MPYCTLQDLIKRFGENELIQLSDKDNVDAINTDTIDSAIADADSIIDGLLGSRYPLPITPVPNSLERIACELTRYYLYSTLATDEVRDRYKEAVKLLEKIAQGKMSIGIDDAGAKPTSQNTAVIESGGNVFNRQDKSFI